MPGLNRPRKLLKKLMKTSIFENVSRVFAELHVHLSEALDKIKICQFVDQLKLPELKCKRRFACCLFFFVVVIFVVILSITKWVTSIRN
jgi:hypothetical protein